MKQSILALLVVVVHLQLIAGTSHCPTNVTCAEAETCCQTPTGLWGCCPFSDGICCDDGIHCCAQNQICLANGTCASNASTSNAQFHKALTIRLGDIPCQDGTYCPDQSTCCPLASGRFGCCPIPNATCCSDHLHCCPSDHQCDTERGRCKRKVSLAMITEVVCPDDSSCPDGETCCRLSSGEYGCCPFPDAVCCSDAIHCCPHGAQCDVEHGQCLGEVSIPWFVKQPAKQNVKAWTEIVDESNDKAPLPLSPPVDPSADVSVIQCPDEKSYCPEETTCCPLANGSYGCCPYANGNCCSDKVNCCPHGYSCDQSGRCTKHLQSAPPSRSERMQKLSTGNDDQLCPDNVTRCSLKTTCCPNTGSQPLRYSCCPYAKGVCCGSNGSLCCPNNYQCDEKQLSCQLQDDVRLRRRSWESEGSLHQCGQSDIFCSDEETCCSAPKGNNDQFACCPFKNGQCCVDGEHCCPEGSRCDVLSGDCIQNY